MNEREKALIAADEFEQEFEKYYLKFLAEHPMFSPPLFQTLCKPVFKLFFYQGAKSSAMSEFINGKN